MKLFLAKILYVIKLILRGFQFNCTLLSKGFFFYPKKFFEFLKKIFKGKFFDKPIKYFERLQDSPEHFLLLFLYFAVGIVLVKLLYVPPQEVVNIKPPEGKEEVNTSGDVSDKPLEESGDSNDSNNSSSPATSNSIDTNPYRKFYKTSFEDINISSLKEENNETVLWLSVDGTTINYPIVQAKDNDYYLDHSFDKSTKKSGWTFLDYRNSIDMSDSNTIFYGHNLLNMTAFGSISNIFEKDWATNSNHSVVVVSENKNYYYTIFSGYYTTPETYYLQTNFLTEESYQEFLDTISSRNILDIDNSVSVSDKIITLSTCTNDNTGRKVIHAKLVLTVDR